MTELEQRELAAVTHLGETLPVWQKDVGPGLDASFSILVRLVEDLWKASNKAGQTFLGKDHARTKMVETIENCLAAGPVVSPGVKKQKGIRNKALGPDAAEQQLAYDVKTLELFAPDFLVWYAESGIQFFPHKLEEFMEPFVTMFHRLVDDEYAEAAAILFAPAHRLREHFGKAA